MKPAFNIIVYAAISWIVAANLRAQTAPTTIATTVPTSTAPSTASSPPGIEKTRAAIASGLTFLASQQNVDGSFQAAGTKLQTSATALLAFLSAGDVPDSGRYGDAVRRVTEFLLRQAPGDRYFGRVDGSRMRGHAIVTLALCEVYGVEPDEATRVRLRATIKDAIAVILAAQNLAKGDASGGWSADPGGKTSDAATTFWCVLAFRAAEQIGFTIPQQNIDRAGASLNSTKLDHLPEQMLGKRLVDFQSIELSPILNSQNSNGSWTDSQQPAASAAMTAMNIVVLSRRDALLPIWSVR